MYNAEQKERFIREYTTKINTRIFVQRIFEHFEPYEEQWGADLCTMELADIQPAFDSLNGGVRGSSVTRYKLILSKYASWCAENSIPGTTDAIMHLSEESAIDLKTTMVKNPRHLQAFLDVVFDPEEEQTSDNNYRVYCWLAYAGIDNEDAFNIKVSDIDFNQMVIHHKGNDYPIYREAIPAMRNCVALQSYQYKHPNYKQPIWRDRIPGDILIRGVRGVMNLEIARAELTKRFDKARKAGKTTLRLSYTRIWLSGVFYRMFEDELAGIEADFSHIVDEKLGDFQYKVKPKGNSQAYMRKKVAERYQSDYERWKQVLF